MNQKKSLNLQALSKQKNGSVKGRTIPNGSKVMGRQLKNLLVTQKQIANSSKKQLSRNSSVLRLNTQQREENLKNKNSHQLQKTQKSMMPNPERAPQKELKIKEHKPIVSYLKQRNFPKKNIIMSLDVNKSMRTMLVQWIIELKHRLRFSQETLYQAIFIIDILLQSEDKVTINNLQLLGIAALFVSAKYQEVYPPRIQKYSQMTGETFSAKQIIDMEAFILTKLEFNLTFPTRFTFISHFPSLKNTKRNKLQFLMKFLGEMSLLSLWQNTNQSEIAEAIYFLSCKVFNLEQYISSDPCQKQLEICWKLMSVWRQNQKGIIPYIYDCKQFEFIGGMRLNY